MYIYRNTLIHGLVGPNRVLLNGDMYIYIYINTSIYIYSVYIGQIYGRKIGGPYCGKVYE